MTSTDPMKNNGLLLGKNEVGMGWCLERLRATAQSRPNARDLAIFQAVPLYYSSLSVKREVKMPSAKRHVESAKAYKFSAMAYLSYLMEQHEFRTPEWLTQGMMGRRTLTAKGEPSLKTFVTPSTTTALSSQALTSRLCAWYLHCWTAVMSYTGTISIATREGCTSCTIWHRTCLRTSQKTRNYTATKYM